MQNGSMVPESHLQAASLRIQEELEGTPSKVGNVKNPTSQALQGESTLTAQRKGGGGGGGEKAPTGMENDHGRKGKTKVATRDAN